MQRKTLIGLLIVSLTGVVSLSTILLYRKAEGALLVLSKVRYDYGEVAYHETLTFEIDFLNGGDKLLRIDKVVPTCKCLVKSIEKRIYEPGEKGQIKVEFIANKGPGQHINHRVAFKTNDDIEPVRIVELTAKMKPSLNIFPRELLLGPIRLDEFRYEVIVITPFVGSGQFKLTSVTTNVSCAEAGFSKLKDFTEAEDSLDYAAFPLDTSYVVFFKLLPQESLGKISGNIEIRTTSTVSPVINVPVQAEVISSFGVTPPMLFFGLREENESRVKKLIVKNEFPFELLMPNNHPHLNINSETTFPTRECTLACTIRDSDFKDNLKGMLRLRVKGLRSEKELSIPYSIILLR